MVGEGVAYALFNIRGAAEVAYRTENPYTLYIYRLCNVMSLNSYIRKYTKKLCIYVCGQNINLKPKRVWSKYMLVFVTCQQRHR